MLAGREAGGFAPPEPIRDRAGRILRLGQYWDDAKEQWAGVADSRWNEHLGIGVAAVDWDEDGDLDLLLGAKEGQLFLRRNEGSRERPQWALDSERIEHDGEPLSVPGSHMIPSVADWDGDGLFDVVSGSAEGGAWWFRNVGTSGAPKLVPAAALLEPKPEHGTPQEPTWPGERTQVCPADFDGDGDLDLLIGDYHATPYVEGQPWEFHGYVWLVRRH